MIVFHLRKKDISNDFANFFIIAMESFEAAFRLVTIAPDFPAWRYRLKFYEVLVIMLGVSMTFYYHQYDMLTFGRWLGLGLLYIFLSCPDSGMCLRAALIAGLIGLLTEEWGCSHCLWNWHAHTTSFHMITIMESAPENNGFPIEVIIAYMGAGFWMASISKVVLAPEHLFLEKQLKVYRQRLMVNRGLKPRWNFYKPESFWKYSTRRAVPSALFLIAYCEPVYRQSALLLCVGLLIIYRLPQNAKNAILCWGCITGVAGIFFEIYATGGIIEDLIVWKYDHEKHHNMAKQGIFSLPVFFVRTAPLSAFFAYIGTGLIVFGSTFHMTGSIACA